MHRSHFMYRNIVIMLLVLMAPGLQAKQAYELMTLRNDGTIANYGLYNGNRPAISSDGRFVTFFSDADQLVVPKTSKGHIFLRDTELNITELISVGVNGAEGNGNSELSDISDDGCWVVFDSYASNLISNDTNGNMDVFLRNRCATPQSTQRISLMQDGGEIAFGGKHPDITPDGHYVVYEHGTLGVVRYDTQTGAILALTGGHGTANFPSISDDGKRVAFHSNTALIPADSNTVWDVYLWEDDNAAGTLSLVSTSANGVQRDIGDESAARVVEAAISGDGRYVSFVTTSSNLLAGDNNRKADVFIKNTRTNDIFRASVTADGVEGNDDSTSQQGGRAALSKTGIWVVFESKASNLNGGKPGDGARTVLKNIFTGETLALDSGFYGSGYRPAISNDPYGRFVAFFSANKLDSRFQSSGVFRYDRHRLPVAVANIDASTVQPAALNTTATLDGSASHNLANETFFAPLPNPGLSYQWQQVDGPATVVLSDATAVKPSFVAPKEGSYRFQLIVSDTVEDSLPATVTVLVGAGNTTVDVANQKPVAHAGSDQNVEMGATVNLDGNESSDADNDPLTYHWQQLPGPISVTLTGANTAAPSFTANLTGSYSFRLVVNDGKESSAPDVVNVVVGDAEVANVPPVAIAGDNQNVNVGATVVLNGSQSYDPESANLTYQWKQISGSTQVLTNPTSVSTNFIAQTPGSYSFELKVSDGNVFSLPDVVTITVKSSNSGNQLPVAVVKVDTPFVTVGSPVKLSGVSSYDPDRTSKSLKYQWVQTDGPSVVPLSGNKSAIPKFTPTEPGDYVFDLAVFDGVDWSTPESLNVHVEGVITITSIVGSDDSHFDASVPNIVNYKVVGLSPKATLKAYLVWVDATTGELRQFSFKQKAKASSTSVKLSMPLKAYIAYYAMGSIPSDQALIALCYSDNFCGFSDLLSVE